MKRLFFPLLAVSFLGTGCAIDPNAPERVRAEEKEYTTGSHIGRKDRPVTGGVTTIPRDSLERDANQAGMGQVAPPVRSN